METSKPLDLNLENLKDNNIAKHNEFRFIHPDFGMAISFAGLKSHFVIERQPYRTKECRILRALKGEARISINLIEYDICQGMLVVTPPNSIIEIIHHSKNYDFQGIVPSNNILVMPLQKEINEYSHLNRGIVLTLSEQEWEETSMYFSIIWQMVQEPLFRREIIQYLLAALLSYIKYIYKQYQKINVSQPTHKEELFKRFINLVNEHSKTERTVSFYADKLCLTPRYLNTVIRQISHQTVMDWINQSIILEAKVLLKHTDLMIYQIADELNFSTPSFFCKYFKRLTGMTPQEYQKK